MQSLRLRLKYPVKHFRLGTMSASHGLHPLIGGWAGFSLGSVSSHPPAASPNDPHCWMMFVNVGAHLAMWKLSQVPIHRSAAIWRASVRTYSVNFWRENLDNIESVTFILKHHGNFYFWRRTYGTAGIRTTTEEQILMLKLMSSIP